VSAPAFHADANSFSHRGFPYRSMGSQANLSSEKLRVLAADSTSMSTQLLVDALAKNEQFHVLEAPPNEGAILQIAEREKPEIVLLSSKIGHDGQAFELIRNLRSQVSTLRVIVMLDRSEPAIVVQAFRAGAHGIFCRTEPFRLLTKCIECVHAGQVWASSSELHFLLEALTKPGMANLQHLASTPLSARETDVVRCVAEGLTNREIAERLKLTEHTVKNYLFRIFDKLGVSSRVEVVLYALGSGDSRVAGSVNSKKNSPVSRKSSDSKTSEKKPSEAVMVRRAGH
jgi:two-component system, NarL family, nitrate/nitrite response regulator NarL